jgi:uncharacterized protein with von Willebrand factor type A (vWA) domain
MNGIDIYLNEVEYNFEVMKDIWVNYPEKRKIREKLAENGWLSLYNGEKSKEKISFLLDLEISKLSKFHEFSKGNKELSSKLISEFFSKIKEKYHGEEILDSQEYFDFLKSLKNLEVEKLAVLKIPAGGTPHNVSQRRVEMESELAGLGIKDEMYESLFTELSELKELESNLVIKYEMQARISDINWFMNIDISDVEKGILKLEDSTLEKAHLQAIREYLERFLHARESWTGIFDEVEIEFEEYYQKLKEVNDIFESMAMLAGMGWDLNKNVFSDKKWLEIQNISKLLEEKEKLKKLIDSIGRMKENDSFDFDGIIKEVANSKKKKISKLSKNETLGTYYSNDLTRVLPMELVNLTNEALENIFYSKYIEDRLNTYLLGGKHFETQQQNKNGAKKSKKKQKGPIIMCVDTSSSMMGEPEKIAKACVFAMMKKASLEDRRVYLVSFSSIDEIKEYELTNPEKGLENLLEFLLFSFGGGTDYVTPLKRSIKILKKENYRKADILLVSDGMCDMDHEYIKKLKLEKEKLDFKIHSFIIGSEIGQDGFSDRIINYSDIA